MLRSKAKSSTLRAPMELNNEDKLIRDEVAMLNNKKNTLPAYAFKKEHAEAIKKRCKYKTKINEENGVFVITKIGNKCKCLCNKKEYEV